MYWKKEKYSFSWELNYKSSVVQPLAYCCKHNADTQTEHFLTS